MPAETRKNTAMKQVDFHLHAPAPHSEDASVFGGYSFVLASADETILVTGSSDVGLVTWYFEPDSQFLEESPLVYEVAGHLTLDLEPLEQALSTYFRRRPVACVGFETCSERRALYGAPIVVSGEADGYKECQFFDAWSCAAERFAKGPRIVIANPSLISAFEGACLPQEVSRLVGK